MTLFVKYSSQPCTRTRENLDPALRASPRELELELGCPYTQSQRHACANDRAGARLSMHAGQEAREAEGRRREVAPTAKQRRALVGLTVRKKHGRPPTRPMAVPPEDICRPNGVVSWFVRRPAGPPFKREYCRPPFIGPYVALLVRL